MNLTILILFLFLAHFLADFIFQSAKLVKWKYKSFIGVLVHTGIHFFIYLLFLLLIFAPLAAFLTAFIIAVTHAIVDNLKIIQENKDIKHYTAFWVDQLVHWFILIFVILIITRWNLYGYSPFLKNPLFYRYLFFLYNPILVSYFILAIFFSKTLELSRYQKEKDQNKNVHLKFNRQIIIKKLFLLTLFFLFILSLTTLL